MHCWKTINVKKQYGFDRIFMLSTLLVLAVFSLFYVVLKMLIDHHLSDDRFALFLLSLILLYPIHKGLHFVPLIRYRHQIHFSIKKQIGIMPILSMRVKEPVPKNRFLLALLTPFLFINTLLIAGAFFTTCFWTLLYYVTRLSLWSLPN